MVISLICSSINRKVESSGACVYVQGLWGGGGRGEVLQCQFTKVADCIGFHEAE